MATAPWCDTFDSQQDCYAEAYGFPPNEDCDTTATCYYCRGTGISAQAPCELTEYDTGSNATRCSGLDANPPRGDSDDFSGQPDWCLYLTGGDRDADNDGDPWGTANYYRSLLRQSHVLEVEPCQGDDRNYCDMGEYFATWLCRWFATGSSAYGWRMWCNSVEHCSAPNCQLVRKQFIIEPSLQEALMFLVFKAGVAPGCFSNANVYCYTAYCGSGVTKKIGCIGDAHPRQARALDWLEVDLDVYWGQDAALYPYSNRYEVELINAAWQTARGMIDRLESPGHDPFQDHDDIGVAHWNHIVAFDGQFKGAIATVGGSLAGETFQLRVAGAVIAAHTDTTGDPADTAEDLTNDWNASTHPWARDVTAVRNGYRIEFSPAIADLAYYAIEGNTPGGSATLDVTNAPPDDEPDPPVRGGADFYSAYPNLAIPITLRGSRTGVCFPAVWSLSRAIIRADLHTEINSDDEYRVQGSVHYQLGMRVKLLPGAYEVPYPFQLMGRPGAGNNPCDLRIEDPDHPGTEHPRERLLAYGPNGERVWAQEGGLAENYVWLIWRGLATTEAYSHGDNLFTPVCEAAESNGCCGLLEAINALEIWGEPNDNVDQDDTQVFEGLVRFGVPSRDAIGCGCG